MMAVRSPVPILALILAAALTRTTSARADALYDPPVGSRWIIQRDLHTEQVSIENGKTDIKKSTMKITSELTVEAKTADGFQMTYARRKSSYDGTVDDAATQRAALAALENIAIQVQTDRTGKPLRVENVDDIKKAVQSMIDRVAAGQSPADAGALRQLLASMTQVDAKKAAEVYLDEVGNLAVAHNTGLKAGETRRFTEAPANPVGPAMIKNISLSMTSAEPDKGDAKLVLTESYDPESIRAFLTDLVKRSGGNVNDVKEMVVSLDAKSDIDVVGGMARSLRRESTTSNRIQANSRVTKSFKTVTVTPAK